MLADIVQKLRGKIRAYVPAVGFDDRFYRNAYSDIALMSRAEAQRHFNLHGRPEGRHGSLRLLIASLEAEYGALEAPFRIDEYRKLYPALAKRFKSDVDLVTHFFKHARDDGHYVGFSHMLDTLAARHGAPPADFDPDQYRRFNPDLVSEKTTDPQYIAHYIEQGRAEGRAYSAFHPKFYRNLYRPDWPLDHDRLKSDWRDHRAQGRFAAWPEMLQAFGFEPGPWVDLLDLAEFRALNAQWAGQVENKEQAALAFVKDGWRRLAPLYLGGDFDPAYYRDRHPELAKLDDQDLYKAWLLDGVGLGEAPSPREQLRSLRLTQYPAAFPWLAYLAYPGAGADKWSALEHFARKGLAQGAFTPDSRDTAFLTALADAYALQGDNGTAIRAFELAKKMAPLAPHARQHLGDAYVRLGLWAAAAREYATLLETEGLSLWTVLNAATCALRLSNPERALEVLSVGKRAFQGDQLWLNRLDEAVDTAFTRQAFEARSFYAQDRVADGDATLLAAVDATAQQLTALAPFGTVIPASADGRIVILANQDLRQCTHYRVEQKAELLDALDRPYEIFSPAETVEFVSALAGATAAIFYRVPAFPNIVKAILTARALGVPTYYEIDDLIFDSAEYPAPIETYGGLVSKASYDGLRFGTPLFQAAMALCDYGIASTAPLARRMAPIVRKHEVFVVRNGLDSHNQDLIVNRPAKGPDDTIEIFYGSGTLAHNSDFLEVAGPPLLDLMRADRRVRLVIVGHLALGEAFTPFAAQIVRHEFVPNASAYWALLAKADINLAVLLPDAMTDCKSEIKWLEAAVFAIPSIVSPTAVYREVLEDGEDVIMAASPQDWAGALDRLIRDPELRQRIGAKARLKAMAAYGIEAGAKSLALAFAPADALRLARPKTKPRLLLVNVFFPPQTIGGATRVVRDNVDSWLASGFADAFDIAIVASDFEADPAYSMRVDAYRGLPVFRIATPQETNMDWRPQNPKVGKLFANILNIWQPDLVHFHATQRLTASCLQACQAAGVPYVVTVHDAWWISDWQFLVDQDGRLQDPATPLLDRTPTGITPEQSAKRKAVLADALHQADAVLAVSDAFAEIYRQAGITETIAVPNGTPHIKSLPRRPSASGRVRLGHMGGMTAHKGYPLIYAALQQGGFDNLELTIVDHELTSGEERQVWGSTPVRIIPRAPQSAVPELYAEMDVLLAPSTWPESFGLVAREALASGLWVVASDLGAMGEDVEPDVNGFVIDVSSPDNLKAVLGRISADPSRYLVSPKPSRTSRSTEDQAADLAEIYRGIVGEKAGPDPVASLGVEAVG